MSLPLTAPGSHARAGDLLIRDLSAELLAATQDREMLRRDLVNITEERDIYREITKGAIEALHLKTEDCRRLGLQLQALRDEHRQLHAWVDHHERKAA